MSFIRVTDNESGEKIDLNSNHIVAFRGMGDGQGSEISLIGGNFHSVKDSPRSLRGYIKKAQGMLPEPHED